jgi:pimeloyl-ACP methyl ester carboxylesterase
VVILWIVGGLAVLVALVSLFLGDSAAPTAELIAKYGAPPSQFIRLRSGATAHYRDQGNKAGLTLVLLPAHNDSLHQWEPWVKRLGVDFRIVSVDLPGQGLTNAAPNEDYTFESTVRFVDEFTSTIGLDKFALGGNSYGGFIAAHFTLLHPQRVSHLILISAGGIRESDMKLPFAMVVATTPIVREVLRFVPLRPVLEGYFKDSIFDQRSVTPELIDRYWDLNRGPVKGAVARTRMSIFVRSEPQEDHYLRANMGTIAIPTLVLGGAADTGTPPSSARVYATGIPDARLILYENVKHFAMIEVPDRSANDVRAFLGSARQQ